MASFKILDICKVLFFNFLWRNIKSNSLNVTDVASRRLSKRKFFAEFKEYEYCSI